MPRKGKGIFY